MSVLFQELEVTPGVQVPRILKETERVFCYRAGRSKSSIVVKVNDSFGCKVIQKTRKETIFRNSRCLRRFGHCPNQIT